MYFINDMFIYLDLKQNIECGVFEYKYENVQFKKNSLIKALFGQMTIVKGSTCTIKNSFSTVLCGFIMALLSLHDYYQYKQYGRGLAVF